MPQSDHKLNKCSSGEMVDALDLGSSVERRVGSSPTSSTKLKINHKLWKLNVKIAKKQ